MKTIKRQSDFPKGAQYAVLNKSGAVEMFYKCPEIKFNDNATEIGLNYFSSFDIWQPSHTFQTIEQLAACLGDYVAKIEDHISDPALGTIEANEQAYFDNFFYGDDISS